MDVNSVIKGTHVKDAAINLSDDQIEDILRGEFGLEGATMPDPIALRAARAVARYLGEAASEANASVAAVIEKAAIICESYAALDGDEDCAEINSIFTSRGKQIRQLSRAHLTPQSPEEFVLTAQVGTKPVPGNWTVNYDRTGSIFVNKDGVGGCVLRPTESENTEAHVFHSYLTDQLMRAPTERTSTGVAVSY